MKLVLHEKTLHLKHPFTISRGSITTLPTLIVELQHEGKSGFGEAVANAYYNITIEKSKQQLLAIQNLIESASLQEGPESLWPTFHQHLTDNMFALSALDCAMHDLFGKLWDKPTATLWGTQELTPPPTSITIGIDTLES